jgi:hypothetical protein
MLSVERLREVLSYDSKTGLFRWKIKTSKKTPTTVGDIAGGGTSGRYWRIAIDGKRYYAHRLAWLYVYGVWVKEIDHKDLNKQNNAIDNLRDTTRSKNNANSRVRNSLGIKGVEHRSANCYSSRISIGNGKCRLIGHFKTAEEAHQAYLKEAKNIHGEFARGE